MLCRTCRGCVSDLEAQLQAAQAENKRLTDLYFESRNKADWDCQAAIDQLQAENAALRADNAGLVNVFNQITENEDMWGQCRYCHAHGYPVDETGNKLNHEEAANAQEYWTDHEEWCPSNIIDHGNAFALHPGDCLLKESEALRAVRDAAEEALPLLRAYLIFTDTKDGTEWSQTYLRLDNALAAVKGE